MADTTVADLRLWYSEIDQHPMIRNLSLKDLNKIIPLIDEDNNEVIDSEEATRYCKKVDYFDANESVGRSVCNYLKPANLYRPKASPYHHAILIETRTNRKDSAHSDPKFTSFEGHELSVRYSPVYKALSEKYVSAAYRWGVGGYGALNTYRTLDNIDDYGAPGKPSGVTPHFGVDVGASLSLGVRPFGYFHVPIDFVLGVDVMARLGIITGNKNAALVDKNIAAEAALRPKFGIRSVIPLSKQDDNSLTVEAGWEYAFHRGNLLWNDAMGVPYLSLSYCFGNNKIKPPTIKDDFDGFARLPQLSLPQVVENSTPPSDSMREWETWLKDPHTKEMLKQTWAPFIDSMEVQWVNLPVKDEKSPNGVRWEGRVVFTVLENGRHPNRQILINRESDAPLTLDELKSFLGNGTEEATNIFWRLLMKVCPEDKTITRVSDKEWNLNKSRAEDKMYVFGMNENNILDALRQISHGIDSIEGALNLYSQYRAGGKDYKLGDLEGYLKNIRDNLLAKLDKNAAGHKHGDETSLKIKEVREIIERDLSGLFLRLEEIKEELKYE